MPPKRKAAARGGRGGKKAKAEPEPEAPSTAKEAIEKLKAADARKPKKPCKVDQACPLSSTGEVHDDYDCMLNQTNIGHNNNKFYIIQVLCSGGKFYSWNRWGRVGETGQNALKGPFDMTAAIADFKKKFKDKTRNDWDKRDNFKPSPGKYTLLLMDQDETEEEAQETAQKLAKLSDIDVPVKALPCTLDKPTQDLIKLIFDNDMFKHALISYDIDVKKMPLGKLSKTQIAKGFEVLEDIEAVLEKKKSGNLVNLTSTFYTLIPHAFGRQRPPPINTMEMLRKKMDMLMVLADIELAQEMQKEKEEKAVEKEQTQDLPHPLNVNYDLLNCKLTHLGPKSKQYKVIENYLKATEGYCKLKIMDAFEVDRDGEDGRFALHSELDNRKLLWHGTNVAVVAAILKSGLRIMPHSGGRVGRGIYFASENGKSAGYVGCTSNQVGIMFLTEVALGKEKHIKRDDHTLKTAPPGFDSIIAKGRTEPDPKKDTVIALDGKKVVVPQGKPITQSGFTDSYFSQSEYLVYKESQARLRYLLKLKFSY